MIHRTNIVPRRLRSSIHHPLGSLHVAFGDSIHVGSVTHLNHLFTLSTIHG